MPIDIQERLAGTVERKPSDQRYWKRCYTVPPRLRHFLKGNHLWQESAVISQIFLSQEQNERPNCYERSTSDYFPAERLAKENKCQDNGNGDA